MTETLSRALSPAAHPVRSPATPGTAASSGPAGLTTARGVALYIGALLGPGLLLLPGLAAAEAGPASVLAWAGLLILSGLFAVVFGSLGRGFPSAGGVVGYVRAGLGARASAIAGWSFLAGVIAGAPVVCLIGAGYVTELTGGGRLARALIAALLLLAVMGLVAGGLRASAAASCCSSACCSPWSSSPSQAPQAGRAPPTGHRSRRTAGRRSGTRPRPSCSPLSAGRRSRR